jgi:hypothetical protein
MEESVSSSLIVTSSCSWETRIWGLSLSQLRLFCSTFWGVCNLIEVDRRFGRTYCLCFQVDEYTRQASRAQADFCLAPHDRNIMFLTYTRLCSFISQNVVLRKPWPVVNDRLCGLVVRVPGYRSRGPGSIPGASRFSVKQWVWNAVHSASWVKLGS